MTLSTWEWLTYQRDTMAAWLFVAAGCIAIAVRLGPERIRKWVLIGLLLLVAATGYLAATGG